MGNRGVAQRLQRMAREANTAPPPELEVDEFEAFGSAGPGPISDKGVVEEIERDAQVERTLPRVAPRLRSPWLMRYAASKAVAYAKKWALSTNKSYPRFSNDCTNFVSQAVLAGGWKMAGGSCGDRKSNSAWWYGDWECWYPGVRASYTWAGAQNFFNFVKGSGRGTAAANVSDLDLGDVLQMQFDGDSSIHHTMIVTDKKDGNLFLSYHTSDHLDEPFWGPAGILSRYPTATYFAWKL